MDAAFMQFAHEMPCAVSSRQKTLNFAPLMFTFAAHHMLRYHRSIQKFLAALLLSVVCLGMAPKAWFHELVAGHKDGIICEQSHNTAVLHQQGFNCHFDDLVVASPFLMAMQYESACTAEFGERIFSCSFCTSSQTFFQSKEGRGPPAA